ncbi:helix-turn-helix domain-containing protein [Brevibacterium sp.]|uniref:TetR/AcrR family transcriptional regulator n=1 Tax=Brevibacterium sp. TaxID=1701 RepID=UPI0025B9BA02|nr:helix-turn-helix domain-containing protein [Brevibacterium sp.]
MAEPASRRTGRPPRLDRARIVEAAVRLADEAGLPSVTMRQVADRVECAPAALYRHFRRRDTLLEAMVDHALGEVRRRPLTASPEADLLTFVRELLAVHASHPWLSLAPGQRVPGPQTRAAVDHVLAVMRPHPGGERNGEAAMAVLFSLVTSAARWRRESAARAEEPDGAVELTDAATARVVVAAVAGVLAM